MENNFKLITPPQIEELQNFLHQMGTLEQDVYMLRAQLEMLEKLIELHVSQISKERAGEI